ncbi:LPS-assembly protein LptD [Blastopirellula retiformator]|uniref:organic solvent tolerance protein OstA n=1 Tax=Blastopirellula retiformator TaxID=2527970 RepID=UPI0011B6D057|nr:organic solvent tolerance protein OstA [Blastopirellula retiformator]
MATIFVCCCGANVADLARLSAAEIAFPEPSQAYPITVSADSAQVSQQGTLEVWILSGNCRIQQGESSTVSRDAVLWIDYSQPFRMAPHKVKVYLEGAVEVKYGLDIMDGTFKGPSWLGELSTNKEINLPQPNQNNRNAVTPAVYQRGLAIQREGGDAAKVGMPQPIMQIQYQEPGVAAMPANAVPTPRPQRVTINNRYATGFQFRGTETDPVSGESIMMFDSGVNVMIEGIDTIGSVNILADRVVLWSKKGVSALAQSNQANDAGDIELYLEGSIVFRQGEQVVYADRMYYNAGTETGIVLGAELLTPAPGYEGLVRLKADVLQRIDPSRYQAFGASITTSRLGVPNYWLQSNEIEFIDEQREVINPITGEVQYDPYTAAPIIDHDKRATARNNFVYMGGVPVFYWPTLSANIENPTFYLNNIKVRNDNNFGFQVLTEWDNYELLGIKNPWEGTEWNTSLDFLSERGFGVGTRFDFNGTYFPFMRTPATGFLDAWGIHDSGTDNLGADRRVIEPQANPRGRVIGRHRQTFRGDLRFFGELGYISDSNFLESYFEREWDTDKDATTGFRLEKLYENQSFTMSGASRVNDFFMMTEKIPQLDHTIIGESLLFDRLTWNAHSSIGYLHLNPADPPTDPVDLAKFSLFPYETNSEGIRAFTTQSLEMPLDIGPTKVTPYALGQVGYWHEDVNDNDVMRGYGQLGVRGSLMMWTANRAVQSQLWNLNGLAHKVTLYGDAFYADSSQDIERFPLYDNLDDDAQEQFARRFKVNTFGLPTNVPLPATVDERFYAIRYGLQNSVTSPSAEIADDLQVARLELRQVWQTKRGAPGGERIIDWIKFDVGASVFPDADRDNFGETIGLVNYDFNWEIGDRLSIVSDGDWDFFDNGLQMVNVGAQMSRPQVGTLYLGYTMIRSPVLANILNASFQYRMTDKWIAGLGTSYDFESAGNLGQNVYLTRIGESSLFTFNVNVDPSRAVTGIGITFEPRFFATGRYSRIAGEPIPPVGAFGLE